MNLNIDPSHIFEFLFVCFLGGMTGWIKWVSKKITIAAEEVQLIRASLETLLPMKDQLVTHLIDDAQQFGRINEKISQIEREIASIHARCLGFLEHK